MVLFFCLTTLQNWQNCPAALTNHSGFLSIQLGFFRTSRGGANNQAHNERHTKIEELMWDTARKLLQLGVNVIFDFGCRAKEERDNFRMKAHSATVRKAK